MVLFGTARSGMSTSWKVSQLPVTGTGAEPRSGPLADPVRTSRKPPAPPEEIRAVSLVEPVRLYGLKAIQSPLSMSPTVLPPWAVALS